MNRWDRLTDGYLRRCESRGLSEATILAHQYELNRWGGWLKRRIEPGTHVYDIEVRTADNRVYTVLRGSITITGRPRRSRRGNRTLRRAKTQVSAALGSAHPAAMLWDSRRHTVNEKTYRRGRTRKIWKPKSNPTRNPFENRRFHARLMPLWDGCVLF